MVFKLTKFDDFKECAKGCEKLFYMVIELTKSKKIIAYAGRVWWENEFANSEAVSLQTTIDELTDMHAIKVEEDTPLELIFRW